MCSLLRRFSALDANPSYYTVKRVLHNKMPPSTEALVHMYPTASDEGTQLAKAKCYSYPGEDATFSSTVFLSLYEEEEACEMPQWQDVSDMWDVDPEFATLNILPETLHRPTIYFVLRMLDSIKGFHKGDLDLSGRHAERYYQLQRQWNRFLCGVLSLGDGDTVTDMESSHESDYFGIVQARHERWNRFLIKWRLPKSTSYNQLIKCTQSVLREIRLHPVPLFQMTRLTDLPPEILDNIVDLASTPQAKALASTCHLMNDIGQRHIFRTWIMKLHVPPHISPVNIEYSSVDLPSLAYYSRVDLAKNANFISNSPHIGHRIKKLVLSDEWWVSRRAHSHENNPFALGMDFYKSVTQIYTSVLKAAVNLSTLVLCNLEINMDLVRRIAEIPHLHTLEFHLCHIPHMVRRRLTTDSALACPRVSNLRIFMDSSFSETHSQWYAILLFPNVRTLSVVQFGFGPCPAPEDLFWTKCRLENLERLSLDNLDAGDLVELVRFFGNNRAAAAYLTHFKLHMDWGVSDVEVISLLQALQSAPLEVLVLEGLAEAEFVVIAEIAHLFPELVALTLVRRQNRNQHQNKLALWPHAAWEYASSFSGFKALRHFCWNFRTEYWDATPSTLIAFESDFAIFPVAAACRKLTLDFDLTDEVPPYFLDSHWMALPFAAHCQTLQTFSLMDRTVDMMCRISHDPVKGTTALTPKYYPTHSFVSWNIQQWNTVGYSWPSLLPLAKPRT